MAQKLYAVRRGRETGVFDTWARASAAVQGFPGAVFKGFTTRAEADAFLKAKTVPYKTQGGSGKASSSARASQNTRLLPYSRPHSGSAVPKITLLEELPAVEQPARGEKSPDDALEIYTDGSALSNGRASARAGWGVYFGEDDPRNCCGRVEGDQTNNRGELLAIEKALSVLVKLDRGRPYVIKSDSQYSINALTKWAEKWERNGWKVTGGKDVLNQDLIQSVRARMRSLREKGYSIRLEYVKGHSTSVGNNRADELARQGAASAPGSRSE